MNVYSDKIVFFDTYVDKINNVYFINEYHNGDILMTL